MALPASRRLTIRSWWSCLLLCLAACGSSQGGSEGRPAERARPNVLLIVVDDLRPALGCYGDGQARTPNLDRLAGEGVLFERAYAQQALCHPSRTSMLVGARPDTTGVYDLRTDFRKRLPDVTTLPQLFREHGWRTLAMGKVHHGGGALDDLPSWSEPPYWPDAGVGYFSERGLAVAAEREAQLAAMGRDENVRGLAWEEVEVGDAALFDGMVLERALAELGRPDEAPFFLAVGFKKPHLPFVAPAGDYAAHPLAEVRLAENPNPPEGFPACAGTNFGELRSYYGMPERGPIGEEDARHLVRGYQACVTFVDRLIGELLARLEQQGLAESTIVVVVGDHGFQLGEHGLWCKHTNTEEATRIPWLVRVPEGLLGGAARAARSGALVELVDLYPTLAELAGLALPAHLEGQSLVPLLREPERAWKRAAFSQYPSLDPGSRREVMGYSLRSARYRYTEWRAGEEVLARELYDQEQDPLVTRNLAGAPALADRQAELAGWLAAGWRGALAPEGPR